MSKKENTAHFSLAPKNAYLIISILAILLYANTLKHGFVLDDIAVIENNKLVKQGFKGIPELFTGFYWEGFWDSNAGLYRPLSLIMFAVEYQLSPDNPLIHHLLNILLYAFTCCMLYKVFTGLFSRINPIFFLLVTLLFVANPLHTEVVANIKSRDEIIALLFFLLCCDQLYLKTGKSRFPILGILFFLLSLLSKEGAIVFLPIIFLFDYASEKNLFTILKKRISLVITSFLWLGWHQFIIHSSAFPVIQYTRSDNSLIAAATFTEQKATALGIFARYIIKLIYPYQVSYDYSFNQIPVIGMFSPLALLGLILFGLLIFIGTRFLKKETMITTAIALILFPLFMTSNLFFNIGATMADRFLFVSTIGSSLLITLLLFKLLKTDLMKNFTIGKASVFFIPVLLIFSFRTFSRNADWKSNAALFAKDVLTVPNSARVHYNYGTALMNNSYGKNDQAAAIKEYELCLQIDPLYYDALINVGAVYTRQKEYPSALLYYRKALDINRNDNMLYGNMGEAFFRSQQPDSAIIYFEKAHLLGNRIPASYEMLGSIWFSRKEYEKACIEFEKGLEINPTSAGLHMNYGNSLAMSGRNPEAIKALEKAYSLDPSNPQPLYFLALTYDQMGDTLNGNKFFAEYQRLKK